MLFFIEEGKKGEKDGEKFLFLFPHLLMQLILNIFFYIFRKASPVQILEVLFLLYNLIISCIFLWILIMRSSQVL